MRLALTIDPIATHVMNTHVNEDATRLGGKGYEKTYTFRGISRCARETLLTGGVLLIKTIRLHCMSLAEITGVYQLLESLVRVVDYGHQHSS